MASAAWRCTEDGLTAVGVLQVKRFVNGAWINKGQRLKGAQAYDGFGMSTGLSADGNTLVVVRRRGNELVRRCVVIDNLTSICSLPNRISQNDHPTLIIIRSHFLFIILLCPSWLVIRFSIEPYRVGCEYRKRRERTQQPRRDMDVRLESKHFTVGQTILLHQGRGEQQLSGRREPRHRARRV